MFPGCRAFLAFHRIYFFNLHFKILQHRVLLTFGFASSGFLTSPSSKGWLFWTFLFSSNSGRPTGSIFGPQTNNLLELLTAEIEILTNITQFSQHLRQCYVSVLWLIYLQQKKDKHNWNISSGTIIALLDAVGPVAHISFDNVLVLTITNELKDQVWER